MIVDTNALSAAAEDDRAVIVILTRADQMAIPAIVLGEYRYGIAQSRHLRKLAGWTSSRLRRARY
jgi:tRNA(fMet)-specific endonuclease VapC